jgi:hypothetical protein
MPASVSKLTRLRDFHVFTSSRSETMSLSRAFTKKHFERVYQWGTSVGIDNITWTPPTMDDIGNVFAPKIIKKKKNSDDEDDEDDEDDDDDEDKDEDEEYDEYDDGSAAEGSDVYEGEG